MHNLNKIVSKFVAKLHKYIILFKDILTFLGLDYRDASLITLYFLSYEAVLKKSDQSDNCNIQKFDNKKVKNQHV